MKLGIRIDGKYLSAMKFGLVFLLVNMFFLGHQLDAQDLNPVQWYKAELTLKDKTVLVGDFSYDLKAEKVQIKLEGRIETYDASQIELCIFYDEAIDLLRLMVALPYSEKAGYKRPKLFEVIVEGKITFLVREYIETKMNGRISSRLREDRYDNTIKLSDYVINLDFNFYFVGEAGDIRAVKHTRKGVMSQFDGDHAQLEKYAITNNLKFDQLPDVAKLVEHYNTGMNDN